MDRMTARQIEAAALKALEAVAAEYGVAITPRGGTLGHGNVTLRIEFATKGADGITNTREAEAWERYAVSFGLPANGLGRKITIKGQEFTIAGLRAGADKRPVLLKNAAGKMFVYPCDPVIRALAA